MNFQVIKTLLTQKKKLKKYNSDKLREDCGIFGISNHTDASALVALGLHALQHRGQEGCGIVSYDNKNYHSEKRQGLVGDNFTKSNVIDKLPVDFAIGHNRYSTTGETSLRNIQPFFADLYGGGLSIAHNGNLTNAIFLREALVKEGAIFRTTSDTETIVQLIAKSKRSKIIDKLIDALFQIQGGYSLILMTNKKLIGVRDPFGIRPLVIGKLKDSYIFASETCALDIVGAKYIREVENGEIVIIEDKELRSIKPFPKKKSRPCIFEYIYFARPDSIINGECAYEYRKKFGEELAKENDVDADIIVPVPDSGVPAAIGYAQYTKKNFELGLIRNHYVGRTFIEPTQSIRSLGVKLKLSSTKTVLENKKIILIDDSLVRGTTCHKIVKMLYDSGAKEVHVRIACPEIKFPDYYGVDMPTKEELLANGKNNQEMCEYIKAKSLKFLSLKGLYKALGIEKRNDAYPEFSDHYFTGDYPIEPYDALNEEKVTQLSLLSGKSNN
jgi:amidophosphoribosyltransferase